VPTYQYTCTECGEPLEAVQKFSDAPLAVCPACGGRLRKVFSAVGIVFKGSGFYRTDSRNGSRAAEPAASSSTTSDSGSSNGSADKAAEKAVDKKADKKAEPAKSSSASEKVA
jgi:putative FmdB family regulatory protein